MWPLCIGMRPKPATGGVDARIADLARGEHGVLAAEELLASGLTRPAIQRRVRTGRLHLVHRGVYAVGHAAVSREGRWLAAVKASGAGAVLSHQSAAVLWELLTPFGGPIHTTVPIGRHPRPTRGIAVHRSRTLGDHDTVRRNRIPVTTPIRTLRDLKRIVPREQWEAAVDRARGRGIGVDELVDEAPTRSVLERRFLRLCRRHRIRAPRANVQVGDFLVDFLWAEKRLIVEVDGYEHHRDRGSFESDRARDAELAVRGYRVLRFTHRQVTEKPARAAARIRALLR